MKIDPTQISEKPSKNLLKIREGLEHSLPFQHDGKKCRSCSCVNSLVSFSFHGASLGRQLPKLRRKGYSCQCITHFGCCIKQKPREDIRVVVTFYRQATNRLPTGSLYLEQNLSADIVGRQVFWGDVLHNYQKISLKTVAMLFLQCNYSTIFLETTSFSVTPDPAMAQLSCKHSFLECSQVPLPIFPQFCH